VEAILIGGGKWIWRGAIVLVSLWNANRRPPHPFASIQLLLDWRVPEVWLHAR
jgi:hypothetical protein